MCVGLHVRLTPARNIFMSQLFLMLGVYWTTGPFPFLLFKKIKKIANPIDAPRERGEGLSRGVEGNCGVLQC